MLGVVESGFLDLLKLHKKVHKLIVLFLWWVLLKPFFCVPSQARMKCRLLVVRYPCRAFLLPELSLKRPFFFPPATSKPQVLFNSLFRSQARRTGLAFSSMADSMTTPAAAPSSSSSSTVVLPSFSAPLNPQEPRLESFYLWVFPGLPTS